MAPPHHPTALSLRSQQTHTSLSSSSIPSIPTNKPQRPPLPYPFDFIRVHRSTLGRMLPDEDATPVTAFTVLVVIVYPNGLRHHSPRRKSFAFIRNPLPVLRDDSPLADAFSELFGLDSAQESPTVANSQTLWSGYVSVSFTHLVPSCALDVDCDLGR